MLSGLDGILFRRESESVVTHRVKDIESLETLVACIYVAGDVTERMTYVKTCAGRIRKHIQDIIFRL